MCFPVEEKLDEIAAALRRNRDVVLTAPPGSGKTTCVPPALLDERWLDGKKIVMLEPRRIAARSCARYISRKLGEPVGGTVGYQVRLERKVSAKTRLEIVTEGLLAQRLLSDPELADVGLVIFDEFHERSLPCDLAFALALEVRRALRPDLRLLVMSATLDADEVAARLNDGAENPCTIVRAEGRMFPVETKYLGGVSMSAAVDRALRETDGDILCFLPGEGEIRRTMEVLKAAAEGRGSTVRDGTIGGGTVGGGRVDVLPLYGSLPKEEQDKVFERPQSNNPNNSNNQTIRKVILATSIAETSITLEGISCVIDSGLMRVPRFSPATGMTGLVTLPLTQDRAEQRRGRAGRVRAGVCYRLWSETEEASHPKKMMPEILDADLASLVLSSVAWGALRREDLPWMTPPPASAWDQAVGLLKLLGAVDESGHLTSKGKRMAKLAMHPRLANMCLGKCEEFETVERREGCERVEAVALLAAIIEESPKTRETDIRRILDEVKETPNRPASKRILQLARRFSHPRSTRTPLSPLSNTPEPPQSAQTFFSEGAALALAYPDRVAKNRGNGTFCMVSGRGAFLEPSDPLAKAPYLVCCELDDRAGDAKVFRACPIKEDEIESLFCDQIVETSSCEWDRPNERVKSVLKRRLGQMVLGERPLASSGDTQTAMLEGVRVKGVANLPCWTRESLQVRARIAFLHKVCPDEGWPAPTDEALLGALAGFVGGMTKWRDLERLDLFAVLDFLLSEAGHDRRELERLAPARMEVPTGSHPMIHYDGDEPTVEVRLQECFGLMKTPKVAGGRVPIVMTLLSPAHRPIQVTKDLEGFWKGAYQLVRKDMRGRYPKHYWPEDPLTAVATRRCRPPQT